MILNAWPNMFHTHKNAIWKNPCDFAVRKDSTEENQFFCPPFKKFTKLVSILRDDFAGFSYASWWCARPCNNSLFEIYLNPLPPLTPLNNNKIRILFIGCACVCACSLEIARKLGNAFINSFKIYFYIFVCVAMIYTESASSVFILEIELFWKSSSLPLQFIYPETCGWGETCN